MNKSDYKHKVEQIVKRIRRKYNLTGEFTKEDFLRICEAEGVESVELNLSGLVYFVVSKKKNDYIYIRTKVSDELFLQAATFGLGCCLMYSAKLKARQLRGKSAYALAQIEADYFSELLLGRSILDAEILESILDAEVMQ